MESAIPSKDEILKKKCVPCEGGSKPLNIVMIKGYLTQLSGWEYDPSRASGPGGQIVKTFHFQNFLETMSFVNAVAYIANREDHHPDLEVSYRACKVKYHTHAIAGLSVNDFICAAKVDQLPQ
jgi:4a-hydroxytetrahydrobiopterin dehydratase